MLFTMAMYKLLFDVHSASTSLKTLLLRWVLDSPLVVALRRTNKLTRTLQRRDGIFQYIALTSMRLINLGLFVRADVSPGW